MQHAAHTAPLAHAQPRCGVQPLPVASSSCVGRRPLRSTATPAPHRHQQNVPAPHRTARRRARVAASAGGGAEASVKELRETAALDDLIQEMLSAKDQQQLAQQVAENVARLDQKFWLRVATRADAAESQAEKDRLSALAANVMKLVEAVVKKTEGQLTSSAGVLQEIMAAGADERGEWHLPLAPEKRGAMAAAMDARADRLDEALLSNAFAWMRKAHDDRLDGIVELLQKVLQLYAGRALARREGAASATPGGADAVLDEVLLAPEEEWGGLIRQRAAAGGVGQAAFMEAVQKRMEAAVLSLESGSYAQRVQAEYLKEVETRAKAVFEELVGQQ